MNLIGIIVLQYIESSPHEEEESESIHHSYIIVYRRLINRAKDGHRSFTSLGMSLVQPINYDN